MLSRILSIASPADFMSYKKSMPTREKKRSSYALPRRPAVCLDAPLWWPTRRQSHQGLSYVHYFKGNLTQSTRFLISMISHSTNRVKRLTGMLQPILFRQPAQDAVKQRLNLLRGSFIHGEVASKRIGNIVTGERPLQFYPAAALFIKNGLG